MNLAETSRQINMTSYCSISGNNSFKSHLNAKSFNMFLRQQQQLCEARFPYFVLPHSTTCHHKFWINQTICQAKPLLFQSQTARASAALSPIQSMLNSLKNSKCSFIFITLIVHTTTSTISTKNLFLYFGQFSPP